MREWNNGLVIICLLLCICVGLTGYAVQTQFVYDQRDVAVINQLIEENNLNIPKNLPHEWNNGISICWSETYVVAAWGRTADWYGGFVRFAAVTVIILAYSNKYIDFA